MLCNPLQRMRITASSRIFKPGSVGYVVWQTQLGDYNLWDTLMMMTRFGKNGKPRIELVKFVVPMVYYETLSAKSREIMEIIKYVHGFEPWPESVRIVPKGPFSHRQEKMEPLDTRLEPMRPESKDSLKYTTWEFLGYVAAMSELIRITQESLKAGAITLQTPTQKVLEIGVDDLNEVRTSKLSLFIRSALKYGRKKEMKNYYDYVLKNSEDMGVRRQIMYNLTKSLSILAKLLAFHNDRRLAIQTEMRERITQTIKEVKKRPDYLKRAKEQSDERIERKIGSVIKENNNNPYKLKAKSPYDNAGIFGKPKKVKFVTTKYVPTSSTF